MKIRDAAFAYVANGWAVLPLWAAREGACACKDSDKCRSPGKHPREDLVPRGVSDATRDLAQVASWPDDINLGVALGKLSGGVMAFDIDDSQVAADLLRPDMGLADQTPTVFTGRRGAHIWVHVTGPTATFHLKRKGGARLGEMRGDGAYVVVPPSVSFTGREYRWIGRKRGDYPTMSMLEVVTDPLVWVAELLSWVDVEIDATRTADTNDAPRPKDPIYSCDIPDPIANDARLTMTRQLLRGNIAVDMTDRSGKLVHLARTLVEVSADRQYDIAPECIAGILKRFDETVFADDPKYANRPDADHYYWTEALNALSWTAGGQGGAPSGGTPPTTAATPTQSDYVWDDGDGWLYLRGVRSVKKVCNFRPEIIEDVEIDYGLDADRDTERAWHIRFTLQGGRSHTFQLHARDNRPGAFDAAIAQACPADFAIASGMQSHVRAALAELSSPNSKRVFATTGWVENGGNWVYLLPGATGGITADGLDTTIRIERDYLPANITPTFDQLKAYGVGVRPPLTDGEHSAAWDAFDRLVTCGPVERTLVVVCQLLAGPLASAGVRDAPPLIHVLGRTGSLKTSYTLAASSMFGTFTLRTPAPCPWSSTVNWLQAMLHRAKDLTLLFDDYKTGVVDGRKAMTRLVNNYADGTGRGRANIDGEGKAAKIARGLMLSNGEDVWEVEASTLARSLQVEFDRGEIDPTLLSGAQDAVKRGELQLFGGAYIRWLAAHPNIIEGMEFPDIAERWRVALTEADTTVHPRIVKSLSQLLGVGTILKRFVADVFGDEAAETLRDWLGQMHAYLVHGITERAEEVEETAALAQMTSALDNAMHAGQVCFTAAERDQFKRWPDKPRAEIIGYYWGDPPTRVLLTRELTHRWFERMVMRSGDIAGFSWQALVMEGARAGGQHVRRVSVWQGERRSQPSGLMLPVSLLGSDDGEGEGD